VKVFKINKTLIYIFHCIFLSSGVLFVFAGQGHKLSVGSKAFERMKQLAGN
jgi:hypothetical protein